MDLAAGQPINESFFVDKRESNSRGGLGIGSTKFETFWVACEEVLLPNSASEERRHDDTIYVSGAHSIQNLIKLATKILQREVDSGELDEMPSIPMEE